MGVAAAKPQLELLLSKCLEITTVSNILYAM